MPEYAEIRSMADVINRVANRCEYDTAISQNTKQTADMTRLQTAITYKVTAETRGKELRLNFSHLSESLYFSMGMSGNWQVINSQSNAHNESKIVKLFFANQLQDAPKLVMHDQRSFAKWKWRTDWSTNRGPDPLNEMDAFVDRLVEHHQTSNDQRPICEMMLDQFFWNGVGNYIRAEVLYLAQINPFVTFNKLTVNQLQQLLSITIAYLQKTIDGGGLQMRNFENYMHTGRKLQMQCYAQKYTASSVRDNTGRTFWFNPRYQEIANKIYNI